MCHHGLTSRLSTTSPTHCRIIQLINQWCTKSKLERSLQLLMEFIQLMIWQHTHAWFVAVFILTSEWVCNTNFRCSRSGGSVWNFQQYMIIVCL